MANPFDDVYIAFWTLLESHIDFTSLVKAGNRIRFDDKVDPVKKSISDADLPEVTLITEGFTPHFRRTSSSTTVTRRYTFLVSTGDFRVTQSQHEIEWVLFRALLDWESVIGALEYKTKKFCISLKNIDVNEGLTDPERNRGIQGWSFVWGCEIEMWFTTSDLTIT